MKRIFFFAVFTGAIFIQQVKAQNLTAAQVQQIVNSRNYMFEAQSVNPQNGITRQLTSDYFLKISRDSLMCELPYFGRMYNAPINPSEAGYDFTSIKFDYAVSAKKKERYQAVIKTKDRTNNAEFFLTIYNNGNAYLQVNSNDRQPISFTGYVKKINNTY